MILLCREMLKNKYSKSVSFTFVFEKLVIAFQTKSHVNRNKKKFVFLMFVLIIQICNVWIIKINYRSE